MLSSKLFVNVPYVMEVRGPRYGACTSGPLSPSRRATAQSTQSQSQGGR